ncbi:MAG TPA: HD domain-containing phosphohydrolase [Methylomusa anaerophila]|uniref:Cyclic di-GMP phosphodiesterase response regulator RpfG n=1 Tax=Methylomusa anaerophila TaxID=1930071 RepID=A0A348AHF8_9FIRM|nr:HD domain-containing phosphohydrolase [Methylomusa anaerophila]BBB90506.1 cyclic di-GMP phosphodiesterase response regulator RpfG [Methylomusa anaerophila]HML89854.1 HD domain-containing phosphohydrolase [Methylomusa anaerophila]
MPTKMIAVKDLTPGMIIGEPVLSASGKVLLGQYISITPKITALLAMWDINYVYIKVEDGIEPAAIQTIDNQPSDPSPLDLSDECQKFFNEYDNIVTTAAQSFEFIRGQKQVPVQELKDTSFSIYSTVLANGSAALDYLLVSDYTIADKVSRHSVMVAFISSIIGRQLKLSVDEIHILILAGLLHDVGKFIVANDNNSNGPQAHVINGAKLLRTVPGLPREVVVSALQHHEYMDGSGFPLGLTSEKIYLFARIIAIANIFHHQTYDEEFSNPFPALDYLSKDMFGKLDPAICQPFIRQVRDSLINSPVLLNDGRVVQVVFFNPSHDYSPVVKTQCGTVIDLGTSKNIHIKRVVAPEYLANAN